MIAISSFAADRPCVMDVQRTLVSENVLCVEKSVDLGDLQNDEILDDNTLDALLSQAFPRNSNFQGINATCPPAGEPMYEVSFPVMHSYNLELSSVIPANLCKTEQTISENGNLLRPSTRLLAKIGRCLLADQYRKQMQDKVRIRGINPLQMTEEHRRDERDYLQQTLPYNPTFAGSIRWQAIDLGGLHEETCIKEGCPFVPDSILSLERHLRFGHYRLSPIIHVSEDISELLQSPSMHYPVNPAIMSPSVSSDTNCYSCPKCNLYFTNVRAAHSHCTKCHPNTRTADYNFNVREYCTHCEDMIEKGSSALPVCQLEISQPSPDAMWGEVNELLEGDPARCLAATVLAVLQLFPNPYSPMGFHRNVAKRILSDFVGNRDQNGGPYSISALRGSHNFVVSKIFEFQWEKPVILHELDNYNQCMDQFGTESEVGRFSLMNRDADRSGSNLNRAVEHPQSIPSAAHVAPTWRKTVCITRHDEDGIVPLEDRPPKRFHLRAPSPCGNVTEETASLSEPKRRRTLLQEHNQLQPRSPSSTNATQNRDHSSLSSRYGGTKNDSTQACFVIGPTSPQASNRQIHSGVSIVAGSGVSTVLSTVLSHVPVRMTTGVVPAEPAISPSGPGGSSLSIDLAKSVACEVARANASKAHTQRVVVVPKVVTSKHSERPTASESRQAPVIRVPGTELEIPNLLSSRRKARKGNVTPPDADKAHYPFEAPESRDLITSWIRRANESGDPLPSEPKSSANPTGHENPPSLPLPLSAPRMVQNTWSIPSSNFRTENLENAGEEGAASSTHGGGVLAMCPECSFSSVNRTEIMHHMADIHS